MPMDENEEWRAVDGCSMYEVSSNGRIRSVTRRVVDSNGRSYTRIAKNLKQSPDKDGYFRVTLYTDNGEQITVKVHSQVCEAFHGKREAGMVAAHRDGNNQNNVESNLYWATPKQNVEDAYRHGTRVIKTHCNSGHLMDGYNVVIVQNVRTCRVCKNNRWRQWYWSKKAKQDD